LIRLWNKFWFEERSRQSLCLLRIFFGIIFFFKLTGFHNLQRIGEMRFRFPKYSFYSERNFHFEGFKNPIPGFEWLPVPDFYQYHIIEELLLIASVFFILGIFTRYIGIFISVVFTYLFLLSQFSYHHHTFLFVVVLLILGFSRCNDHYSIDSLIYKKENKKGKILPIRLLQVFISIVYSFSFIQKLNYSWLSGDIILLFLKERSIRGDFTEFMNSILSGPYLEYFWRSLGPFTLFAEGLLAFGLWFPRLRRFTILVGIMLHIGIDLTIGVATFSLQMMALYIVFIYPESNQNTVYYDGKNLLHRFVVLPGKILDWFQRIKWVDYNTTDFDNPNVPGNRNLQFSAMSRKPHGGIRFIYGLMSYLPVTFVFSFIPGSYLFFKNIFFRLKKPAGQ